MAGLVSHRSPTASKLTNAGSIRTVLLESGTVIHTSLVSMFQKSTGLAFKQQILMIHFPSRAGTDMSPRERLKLY